MAARRPTVLLVDDEPAIRESLGRFLTAAGYKVQSVADPDQGLARLKCTPTDVLILDVRLQGNRSGLELLEIVRLDADLNKLPVMILTGIASFTPVEEAMVRRYGAVVFYKPEGYAALVQHMDHLTGRRPSSSQFATPPTRH